MHSSPHRPFRIHQNTSTSPLRGVLSLVGVILASFAMALLLNSFVFQSFYVDGESMAPTLHTNDRLIISKVERTAAVLRKGSYVPERGQIVVINGKASPESFGRAPELIKRVVGIPGDTVEIRNGAVTITTASGARFDSDESLGLNLEPTYAEPDISITVPQGHVYVLGDNRGRGESLDSRGFGVVDVSLVDGRLWARIMPFANRRVF